MTYKQLKYYITQKIARPFTQYKNGYTVWCATNTNFIETLREKQQQQQNMATQNSLGTLCNSYYGMPEAEYNTIWKNTSITDLHFYE